MTKRKKSRASKRAFLGDRVLCLYLLLSCCCMPLWAREQGGQEPEWPINESLRKFLGDLLDRPNAEFLFAIPVVGLIIGWFALLVGLYRSRIWALWIMLVLNLPSAVYAAWTRDWISAIPAAAIVAYCGLRVSRVVG